LAEQTERYRRLPGRKKSFLIGYYTLWQGPDHLLQIYSRFGVEDYRRFYFSDIQGIITRKTVSGKIQNLVLGCLGAFFGFWAMSVESSGWSRFHGAVTLFFLVALMINYIRGATCETLLVTAVQAERLHSLYRLKKAVKIMDRLQPLIGKAQESFTRDKTRPAAVRPPLPTPPVRSAQRTRPAVRDTGQR
jgi:hypothetical protein